MLDAIFCVCSLWEASTKFATITTLLLCLPVWEGQADLLVRLSMILEHLSQRITTAVGFKVVEGDFTGDSLALDHAYLCGGLSVDQSVLFCRCWMLSNGLLALFIRHGLFLRDFAILVAIGGGCLHCCSIVDKFVDQWRGHLFGVRAARVRLSAPITHQYA